MDVLKIVTGLIFFLSVTSGWTQTPKPFENLSIDRPDVSNLPTTVRPGHFQFEVGSESYKTSEARETFIPNSVLRTGINKKSELRIGLNNFRQDSLFTSGIEKILVATLSIKYRLVEEKGVRPSIAIQPEFAIPFGQGQNLSREEANFALTDYSLLLLFNNTLHKKVFINYNAGIFWNKNKKLDYLLSASTSFAHTHRVGYFFEVYSLIEDKQELPISFDAGITYLLAPRFQLDGYFGNREDGEIRYWFYGAGIGFRIDADDLKPKTFRDIGIHH
jgi:hypothetical protein